MMNTLTLLLVALSLSCCTGQSMESIPSSSVVKKPGETLSLSCRGSGFTFSCCSMYWIRQPSGKALGWMGRIYSDASGTDYSSSVQGRIEITRDNSNNMVYLRLSNLKPEDSAVYYCAKYLPTGGYFDYWGRGTEVTVSSETTSSPTLYPLLQCDSDTGNKVTVGCLARDFFPKSIDFQWNDARGTRVDSAQYISSQNNKYTGVSVVQVSRSDIKSSYNCSVDHLGHTMAVTVKLPSPPRVTLLSVPNGDTQVLVCTIEEFLPETLSVKWKKNGNHESGSTDWIPKQIGDVYSAVSVLKVKNADWESKAVYTCEVTHKGKIYEKKASKAPITVTLNPPSPKEFFNNKQAVLECIVNGQDNTIVTETEITWQIDGQNVTSNSAGPTKTGSQYIKTSTLTRTLTEWQQVNTVSCSANRKDMTPVTQDLIVRKGDGSKPTVTVHILSEEDIKDNSDVTLVCLVSSSVQQDYYIAWSEDAGQNTGNYVDGITFPPQKTQPGYSVISVYTIKKEKWNQQHSVFNCSVWPAGSNKSMITRGVSTVMEMNIAVSCTDDSTEEDEFSSLWSTTSSFIFLFIFTLFYNMIFSLVKMKSQ